jgi:hypothetical protein
MINHVPGPGFLAALDGVRKAKSKVVHEKPVDHQEVGDHPDPALMTQTPGVGTITFDTSMGETMVSSLSPGALCGVSSPRSR